MKTVYYSIVPLCLIFVSCGAEETSESNEVVVDEVVNTIVEEPDEVVNSFVISEGTVGIFVVGREVPDLPKELKMRKFTEEDEQHNVIFNQLEDVVELIMNQDVGGIHHEDKVVEEMMVLSGYYETAEGLAVGSTVEDFIEKAENAKVYYSNVIQEIYLESPIYPNIQFIIAKSNYEGKLSKNSEKEELSLSDLVFGATIEKIRVY